MFIMILYLSYIYVTLRKCFPELHGYISKEYPNNEKLRPFVPQPREDLNRSKTIDEKEDAMKYIKNACSSYQSDRPDQSTSRLPRTNYGRGQPYQDHPLLGKYQVQAQGVQQPHQGDKDHTKDLSKLGAAHRHVVSHFHSSDIDMTQMNEWIG